MTTNVKLGYAIIDQLPEHPKCDRCGDELPEADETEAGYAFTITFRADPEYDLWNLTVTHVNC